VFVLTLDRLGRSDLGIAGGKGANLGEMIRAGLPVPRGFVVTTRAYQIFLDAAGLGPTIKDILAASSSHEASRAIQDRITACNISGQIAQEILTAYSGLGTGKVPVAVRSSATTEDLPTASFAGQHDTFLNIRGEDAILSSVRACWASLWTERAIAYREAHGIDHFHTLMAVVVQEMVDAEVSGVMFTVNPVSGSRDEAVIEACLGLGEALVTGKVTPDRFKVKKGPPPAKAERTAGAKAIEVQDDTLFALVGLGTRIEELFGSPQDIEWCLRSGKLFVLQSRPVTAIGSVRPVVYFGSKMNQEALRGRLIVWSSWNVRETMPVPQMPFGWSFWNHVVIPLAFEIALGVRRDDLNFDRYHVLDRVNGRLYFNMNVLYGWPVLGWSLRGLLKYLDRETAAVIDGLIRSEEFKPMRFPHPVKTMWNIMRALAGSMVRLPQTMRELSAAYAARAFEDVGREASELAKRDLSRMKDEEIFREAEAVVRSFVLKVWPTFIWYALGLIGFIMVKAAVKGWPDIIPEKFLSGLPPNKTTETALEMWKLFEGASVAVRKVLREVEPDQIQKRLAELPEGKEFLERLQGFLARYGHRALMEFDITAPRWKDDPRFVFQALKNYTCHKTEEPTPLEHFRRQSDEREAIIKTVRKRFSQGGVWRFLPPRLLRRWLFERGLKIIHGYYPIRENAKFYAMTIWQRAREMYMEVGRRLAARGILEEDGDLFCFSHLEIMRISRGEWQDIPAIRRTAKERKKEAEKWRSESPPLIVRSDGKAKGKAAAPSGDILHGSPASPGTVRGRASVILDPVQGARIETGDVLVAPLTDPAWTPLFLTAGGLVMEAGGMMSHGAVVAREYGIPAVVGVTGATRAIRTGDIIEVDGSAGQVRVLERPETRIPPPR